MVSREVSEGKIEASTDIYVRKGGSKSKSMYLLRNDSLHITKA